MKLSELGEFGLIKELAKMAPTDRSVKVGIGDDAAVVKLDPRCDGLLTTDMLVEGVHFNRNDDPKLIGRKAISASLSDIAAMGGKAKYVLVSLGVSPHDRFERIKALYQGMISRAKKYDAFIVGGDTVSSEKLVINVAIYGEVEKNRYICRSGARVGDGIYVTGSLGNSFKSKHHLSFSPRLMESAHLTKKFIITSMIDISDGLVAELGHIIASGPFGACIYEEMIPMRENAELINALYDGEDFELLFTAPAMEEKQLLNDKKYCFLKIGEIVEGGRIKCIKKNGQVVFLNRNNGFRHF